jgi:hypothetical protein
MQFGILPLQVTTLSLGQTAEAFMSVLEVLDLAGKGLQVVIMHCSYNFEFGNLPLQSGCSHIVLSEQSCNGLLFYKIAYGTQYRSFRG